MDAAGLVMAPMTVLPGVAVVTRLIRKCWLAPAPLHPSALACPALPLPLPVLPRRYSEEFEATFMEHMRQAHPRSRIAANVVYNEYINDRWVRVWVWVRAWAKQPQGV